MMPELEELPRYWRSDADREGYLNDLMLFGEAIRSDDENGRLIHIPLWKVKPHIDPPSA